MQVLVQITTDNLRVQMTNQSEPAIGKMGIILEGPVVKDIWIHRLFSMITFPGLDSGTWRSIVNHIQDEIEEGVNPVYHHWSRNLNNIEVVIMKGEGLSSLCDHPVMSWVDFRDRF